MQIDNSTNIINGLFQIPDEGSFIKKLILSRPTVFNPDVVLAFKVLQENYPSLELIQKAHYFALLLPTVSPGVTLEAMLITTEEEGERYFSLYHRLHFDQTMYPGMNIIESDAFLRMAAVVTNVPINDRIEGLASLLNYQIKEALNIEITMLSLADANPQVVEENVLPYVMNTIARYMLAAKLDDTDYIRPMSRDELSSLIARWCDLPLLVTATGVEKLEAWEEDVIKSENAFIPEFASSTTCLMFLYLEQKTSSALLDKGGFKLVKEFLLDKANLYHLKTITGAGETLGNFRQLDDSIEEEDVDFSIFDPNS
ncbi:hypothetical protein [Sulfurimonas sp. HSL3-7]|uniref:hypothetical protein n=1 Tax=Sulfonitrofixus jiaomeiensis TaxID=3131938 RepID=UPI0031FA04AB